MTWVRQALQGHFDGDDHGGPLQNLRITNEPAAASQQPVPVQVPVASTVGQHTGTLSTFPVFENSRQMSTVVETGVLMSTHTMSASGYSTSEARSSAGRPSTVATEAGNDSMRANNVTTLSERVQEWSAQMSARVESEVSQWPGVWRTSGESPRMNNVTS